MNPEFPVPSEISADIEEFRAVFDDLDRARQIPICRFTIPRDRGIFAMMPHITGLHRLSLLLVKASVDFQSTDQTPDEEISGIVQLVEHLGPGGCRRPLKIAESPRIGVRTSVTDPCSVGAFRIGRDVGAAE